MLESQINKLFSLPELKFTNRRNLTNHIIQFEAYKSSEFEVCPKCATKTTNIHDQVYVQRKDVPIRDKIVYLRIRKRRFRCQDCNSVFREPVPGIRKGFRSTQRFISHIRWCASYFIDLKRVTIKLRCSSWLVYKVFYEQLSLEAKKMNYEWPKTIGVDEYSFVRNTKTYYKEFATVFVDFNNNKVHEVTLERSFDNLMSSKSVDIKCRENVKNVVIDMSSTYKEFVNSHFPNTKITSDKFHVIKLFNHVLNKIHIETMKHPVFLKPRTNPMRRLYLTRDDRLSFLKDQLLNTLIVFSQSLKRFINLKRGCFQFTI